MISQRSARTSGAFLLGVAMDVMFYEAFEEEARALRKILSPAIDAGFTAQTIQASLDSKPPAALISVRTQSIIPTAWSSSIKGLLTRSSGYDHIVAYRKKVHKRIPAGHLFNYCSRAVAEQAVLLMLALLRKLPQQLEQFEVFHRDGLTGMEAKDRRVLIVGVGNIGREIVGLTRGLGMEVRGVDLVRRVKGLKYVKLQEGISWADVVFCALPLTKRTAGLMGQRLFCRAKRRPFLVNIARGEITPLRDMIKLLDGKFLSGLALDVYQQEGILADSLRSLCDDNPLVETVHRLQSFENVIFTPHNAFNTTEALLAKCQQTVEAIVMFLQKGRFPHSIDDR
jgi:D-lactate dehydrogenase